MRGVREGVSRAAAPPWRVARAGGERGREGGGCPPCMHALLIGEGRGGSVWAGRMRQKQRFSFLTW